MPKAKRVHSTPRRTASKIKAKKSAELTESEEQRNLRHGNAFRGLETPVRELFCMSEITGDLAMESPPGDRNEICAFLGPTSLRNGPPFPRQI